MKTHIQDPITFAMLSSIVINLESLLSYTKKMKFPLTSKILKDTIKGLKEYLVSWNRLSRMEVKDILQATKAEESGARSFFQKLLGTGR